MKRFYVFHNPNFLDRVVCGGIGLELVAMVEGENIEDAYRDTNNIDCGWWENDNVVPMFEGQGCRSTSMYDVVIDDDVAYVCMACGWEKHDHLTKWWNKLKKERVVKAVDERIQAIKEFENISEFIPAEEDFLSGRYDTENEPFHFTFDVKDTVADCDIPF